MDWCLRPWGQGKLSPDRMTSQIRGGEDVVLLIEGEVSVHGGTVGLGCGACNNMDKMALNKSFQCSDVHVREMASSMAISS